MDAIVQMVFLILWGSPLIAIITCIRCHRHRVLLWLGGTLVVATGSSIVYVACLPPTGNGEGRAMFVGMVILWVIPAPLTAGIILLAAGVQKRALARRAGQSGPVEPKDDPGSGSRSDG